LWRHMKRIKKSYYIDEVQFERLKFLSSVLHGQPDVSNLVREGINLVCEKHSAHDYVKQALSERTKKKGRMRLLRRMD